MNRHIKSKRYGQAKIWDTLRPGKTQAGTRDTEAEIRDVPGYTGQLASLLSGRLVKCGQRKFAGMKVSISRLTPARSTLVTIQH